MYFDFKLYVSIVLIYDYFFNEYFFFVYVGVFYNWWCLNEIDRWRNLFV